MAGAGGGGRAGFRRVLDEAGALPLVQGLEADPGLRSRDGLRPPRPLPAAMRPGARAAAPALPAGPVLAVRPAPLPR